MAEKGMRGRSQLVMSSRRERWSGRARAGAAKRSYGDEAQQSHRAHALGISTSR
jgi:hypothetical protein